MRKYLLFISLILLFPLAYFNNHKLTFETERIEWSNPLCISDTGYTEFLEPAFSIVNSNHIIFAYRATTYYYPPEFRNINIYVKELRNGILSDTINLTNSVHNSMTPIMKTDGKGITHLIWGYNSARFDGRSLFIATDIYYSFFNYSVWSNPAAIYHKDTGAINNAYGNAKLRKDSKNRLHLIWRASDTVKGARFYYRIEENCTWSEIKELPFKTADYDFIFDKNDRLHIVILRPDYSGGYDENSVFYRFSDDYGETWSDSVLVHKSGRQNAIKVQILLDQKNNIHILWTKNLYGNNLGGEAIYHSYSSDGIKWSEPKDAAPRSDDGFLYFSAAVDNNNRIHLIYDLWKSFLLNPTKLCYTYWDGAAWSVPEDLFNDGEWPSIEIDSASYLHLLYVNVMNGHKYYTKTTKPLITLVGEKENTVPNKFELYQNYPNPFNPTTIIHYEIPNDGLVTLKVYDELGREVKTLVNLYQNKGRYDINFNASNLASGIYFYQLRSGSYISAKKMLLLK